MTEPKRARGRPATGETPKRYLRVGQLWDDAAAVAKDRGETLTALVIRAIERELARLGRRPGVDRTESATRQMDGDH